MMTGEIKEDDLRVINLYIGCDLYGQFDFLPEMKAVQITQKELQTIKKKIIRLDYRRRCRTQVILVRPLLRVREFN